ncbi:hypothetical protein M1M18_gp018 [Halorubrum virus Serpecor1]|uniref:Uncharacterized protein n=1 Tax=Halorubrum virus Serpecor1 TaxID=2721757 RepID=A0A6G9RZ20_9CAUD|nr:hypothetical protein M1M18_gp018 [Halorubrum virus Serpecor1]QIR31282.1 hypothetical protein HrrSp1_605 [Halorubrum virus Serpecor1]
MSLEEHIIEELKAGLDVFAAEYAVDEENELDAIFAATELLEEDLGLGERWIVYENFIVDTEGYPRSVVEIEVFTDADESEFEQAEAVYEAGY